MKVRYSYITEKFAHPESILDSIRELLRTGDFTLGKPLRLFEERFAHLIGTKHAVGVANGTDAIKLALQAWGVGPGDEVIAPANTFIATIGAIVETGATPVLVDVGPDYVMDVDLVPKAITSRTKAIVPVHFTGEPVRMDDLCQLADDHDIAVIEDACQAICAEYEGVRCGAWGHAAAFSLHPLKNLNVWGDGGVIVTSDDRIAAQLRLLQNHGLKDRDTVTCFGVNSRLDSLHAIVANHQISEVEAVTERRRQNAAFYDEHLTRIPGVSVIARRPLAKSCFHLYMFEVMPLVRDKLVRHLQAQGIEAKVHYPVPLYLQPALASLGHSRGDFPEADRICESVVTLPVDELLTAEQKQYVVETIAEFFR